MFVLQVSFRNHDSHKLYYDLYQGDGRVIDMEIIFYSTELNHTVKKKIVSLGNCNIDFIHLLFDMIHRLV